MKKQKQIPNPELIDEENPEWTSARVKKAVPFSALPVSLQEELARAVGKRGPQKEPTKEMISIRLSPDVVHALRSSGRGWQARVDAHLREWVSSPAWRGKKARTR